MASVIDAVEKGITFWPTRYMPVRRHLVSQINEATTDLLNYCLLRAILEALLFHR